jgi:hypothetical protein
MDNVDILSIDALKNLESLTLHDTRKSNIDLSYLTDYKNLTEFQTSGHVKNISSITELPNLKSLTLWKIKKKNSLSFITHIKGLKELSIYLGGRESIEEINNSNIENLKIVRVRGLQSLGNLGRFPNLEILRVEDQIKLKDIKFHKNSNLIKLLISNCKTLSQLLGIEQLKNLTLLNIHKTAVEYETFIEQELPKTISHLGFYTTKSTINKKIKTDLDLKGYK